MAESSEPTPTGQPRPLLGPEQVGRRVVVRRVLHGETGPSGGPALTDVLGVMESWDGGEATIRREDGSVVTIRIADIVSGKPVPPRPQRRGGGAGQAGGFLPQISRGSGL